MHPHEKLIEQFYSSFQQRNYQAMAACYHPEIHFRDAAFDLHGKAAGAMWHMLCERGKDLELTFRDITADDTGGSAFWEARYTFGQTGRKVVNKINASFSFRDGLIVEHVDRFDFWRWSSQALGPAGTLLGWSGFLQKKVSSAAMKSLEVFMSKHSEYRDA